MLDQIQKLQIQRDEVLEQLRHYDSIGSASGVAGARQKLEEIDREIDELKYASAKLSEAETESPDILQGEKKHDFAFDFDKHAEMPGLNDIVQNLLDSLKVRLHNHYIERIEKFEKDVQGKAELAQQNKTLQEQLQNALAEKNQIKLERDDFEKRFNNAGVENKELKEEIERINNHVNDLQIQLANAPAPCENPVDVNDDELQKLIQRAEENKRKKAEEKERIRRESIIKVTNKRWEDPIKKLYKLAERVDTGETIRYHYFEDGAYLEVTAEEAENFRNQNAIQNLALDEQPVIKAPDLTFRTENGTDSSGSGLEAQDIGGIGQDTPNVGEKSIEEAFRRIEALESRVDALTNLSEGLVSNVEQLRSKGLVA